jgi:hypothetical protein
MDHTVERMEPTLVLIFAPLFLVGGILLSLSAYRYAAIRSPTNEPAPALPFAN